MQSECQKEVSTHSKLLCEASKKNLSRPEKSSFLHEGAKKVCGRDYVLRDHTNHCLKQWVYDHKSNFHNTQEPGGGLPKYGL